MCAKEFRMQNKICALILMAHLFLVEFAYALPFNDDMVNTQMKTGQIMRPKVDGSVPLGMADMQYKKKDELFSLVNPSKNDALSAWNGARLFRVNCFPCHGDIAAKDYKDGSGGPATGPNKFMTPPNLTSSYYENFSDGQIYATIEFGGLAMMPAMGWKLSVQEHWDIINYIRKVQNSK